MNITPELLLDALTGKLPSSDIGLLTGELRSLSASTVLSIAAQGGISIEGDGNIVGDNNTSIVVKGEGAAELARVLRETLERGRVLFQLRSPVADFVGREQEIATLTDALRAGKHAGINGMGGTGKSELALLVAGRVRGSYPDAQLFINLHGSDLHPRRAEDALAACIRSLVGAEAKLPEGIDELTQIYRNQLSGKRALIVLDNAAENSQIRALQPPQGSVLLVTSRSVLTLTGMTRVSLDQLQPKEGRTLLVSIAAHTPLDVADQICLLCGHLPLAIRAAGSLLSVKIDLDPADYAAQLRDERTRLERIGKEDVDLGTEASFNLSYERLSPEAARVFGKLAFFPTSFDATAEENICVDSRHANLSELVRLALVLYERGTKRYRLHDLVRLFAAARLGTEERTEGRRLHATHYQTVLATAAGLYLKGGETVRSGLTLLDLEWRNIEAGQAWAETEAGENDQAAELCITYPDAGVYVLNLRQHPRERIRWLEVAVNAARRLRQRDSEGNALGNLGNAYSDLGETKRAIGFYEQHLKLAREGDRRSEGTALGNLGVAYANLGEIRRAVEFYEQQLVIVREIGDRRFEGNALGNLGVAYAELGEIRRAVEVYQQQLVIVREIGDRHGEGAALGNLGNAFVYLGDTRRAIDLYEQALMIIREIGDRRFEGAVLGSLGSAYAMLGEAKQAIDLYEQYLVIAREMGDRRGEGEVLGNLGFVYANLGETERAIELHEQYLVIAREIGDRRGEGLALCNKSVALDKLGKRAQAIAAAEEALTIYEQIEDPNAAKVRAQLAEWRSEEADNASK